MATHVSKGYASAGVSEAPLCSGPAINGQHATPFPMIRLM
jgi:hypothetical protein